jgi:hypothetical protein
MGIGVEEWAKDLGEAASSVGPMAKGCEIYAEIS